MKIFATSFYSSNRHCKRVKSMTGSLERPNIFGLSTEAPLILPFCRWVAAAGVVSSVCSSFCPCSACFETKPWWLSGWDPSSQRAALSWGRRVEGWHCNKSSRYGAVFRLGLSGRGLFSQVVCAHGVEAQADVPKWALLQERRNGD